MTRLWDKTESAFQYAVKSGLTKMLTAAREGGGGVFCSARSERGDRVYWAMVDQTSGQRGRATKQQTSCGKWRRWPGKAMRTQWGQVEMTARHKAWHRWAATDVQPQLWTQLTTSSTAAVEAERDAPEKGWVPGDSLGIRSTVELRFKKEKKKKNCSSFEETYFLMCWESLCMGFNLSYY